MINYDIAIQVTTTGEQIDELKSNKALKHKLAKDFKRKFESCPDHKKSLVTQALFIFDKARETCIKKKSKKLSVSTVGSFYHSFFMKFDSP